MPPVRAIQASSVLSFSTEAVTPWGRAHRVNAPVARPTWPGAVVALPTARRRLPVGARRSYGDVALSSDAALIDMTWLDRFISFDPATGFLRAQAGVTLAEILKLFAPRGFFLPVLPGTAFVTLGGAIANDVHGKNHHSAGTFGRHVRALTLLRSDRGVVEVTPQREPELFTATIGGLGLTGVILDVTLELQPIPSTDLIAETVACPNLDNLCDALEGSSGVYEHTAAWIDCTARGRRLGRGLLNRARWAQTGPQAAFAPKRRLTWPTDLTGAFLNPLTLRLFNEAYYAKGALSAGTRQTGYGPVLNPLDGIGDWNKLYGPGGFFQHQCVIPKRAGREPLRAMLGEIAASGQGSFLAVLKMFGDLPSPGLMSFPMAGYTLALDFAHKGGKTLALLERLDVIVAEAGGRLYAAKDGRMSAQMFQDGYPNIARFRRSFDPACRSDLAERLNL